MFTLQLGTRSVTEFFICFWVIAEESRWGKIALRSAFLNALNDNIKDQIATRKTPRDLEELISLAI